jgi:magnesium transporter
MIERIPAAKPDLPSPTAAPGAARGGDAVAPASSAAALARAGLGPLPGLRVLAEQPVLWIDLDDPAGPALDALAARFGFHELAVEDCRNHPQLAKIDQFEGHAFLIANSVRFDPETGDLGVRELDFFVGPTLIVTVHEGPSFTLDTVASRLGSVITPDSPARILHAILDETLERFLPSLERIGETIGEIEDEILDRLDPRCLSKMFGLKRDLVEFRRAAWAQRELLNALSRRDGTVVPAAMQIYFRDVYDHIVTALEMVESYRDLLSGVVEIYLTQAANRTNDTVKALTIIATIILPLTLVTGWYGMNVANLPLASHPYGVWIVSGAMVLLTAGLLTWFRKRRWI